MLHAWDHGMSSYFPEERKWLCRVLVTLGYGSLAILIICGMIW